LNYIYHEEEISEGSYDRGLVRRLLGYLRPYKAAVFLALILQVSTAFLDQLIPYLTKYAIDNFIMAGDRRGLGLIAAIFIAVLIALFWVYYLQSYITRVTGQRVMRDMRDQIFSHLQRLPLSFFDRNPIGRLVTRATNDVQTLEEIFTSGVVSAVSDILNIAAVVVFMLILNARLALISLSVLPLLFWTAFFFQRRVRKVYRRVRAKVAKLNSFLQENIVGMETIQIFNRAERNFLRFRSVNGEYLESRLKAILYYSLFTPAMEFIGSAAVAIVIWYGGNEMLEGKITVGVLVAFLQYVQRFFWPVRSLSEKYNMLQSAMASSERIFELLDAEPEDEGDRTAGPVPPLRGEIEFNDVWFSYNGSDYVLKGVSFKVGRGERVAIVGATGSGKTTIISLLCRFYDIQRGSIKIDGVDIREMDRRELRRRIGVVQQDVFLFSGDIERNISLGDPGVLPETVRSVSSYVNAHTFIERLPKGYASEVKERGLTLSTGQRQLLSFARALAFDPEILVLDEATSSVDAETEGLIQDAIDKLMRGRTSIIIAHRLSTIRKSDRIIVLHKGEVREAGTHRELLAKKGIYYRLYQLQYRDQEGN